MRAAKDDIEEKPSKSERKRVAHAAQELGERLIRLREAQLAALGLPETLVEAIRDARNMVSRGGAARQRQYIGKLMREIDPQPIHAALAAQSEQSSLDAERFKRLEAWREQLLGAGPAALHELERWRPGLDRAQWVERIAAAQTERAREGRPGPAARELFRALRTLFEGEP
ncbi:MAG TPA: ribosome biogenesis factor YjgA [Steroidobacteraceae bacterium]